MVFVIFTCYFVLKIFVMMKNTSRCLIFMFDVISFITFD